MDCLVLRSDGDSGAAPISPESDMSASLFDLGWCMNATGLLSTSPMPEELLNRVVCRQRRGSGPGHSTSTDASSTGRETEHLMGLER